MAIPPGEVFYTANNDPVHSTVQMGLDANGRAVPMGSPSQVYPPPASNGGTPTGTAGSPNAAVVTVQGITNGTNLAVADAAAEAALGTPADTAWTTGSGTLVALGKAIVGKLSGVLTVTLNGMLPAGTNLIGALSASGTETPFIPVPNATTGLTVGPTATTAPVALATVTASTYRIRNAASSASPVSWRLATTNSGQSAVLPVSNSTAGTGGTVGDKTIDPGGVEIFALTVAQQTAIAAGTLYISAITPANGSATIFVTPGVAGA